MSKKSLITWTKLDEKAEHELPLLPVNSELTRWYIYLGSLFVNFKRVIIQMTSSLPRGTSADMESVTWPEMGDALVK